jgi:hypothetical protein
MIENVTRRDSDVPRWIDAIQVPFFFSQNRPKLLDGSGEYRRNADDDLLNKQ